MGSCLTLGSELSEETHVLTKQRLYWEVAPPPPPGRRAAGGRAAGEGTQESCAATWLTASGFMGLGLVSRLSLASRLAQPIPGLSRGPSWWPHTSQPR